MKRRQDFWEKTHETSFRVERPSVLTIDVKVKTNKEKRSRISKSFGPNFVVYAFESEPQIFKEVMSTPKAKNVKRNWKRLLNDGMRSLIILWSNMDSLSTNMTSVFALK